MAARLRHVGAKASALPGRIGPDDVILEEEFLVRTLDQVEHRPEGCLVAMALAVG